MEYTSIQADPPSETSKRIRIIFRDIEKKARLSGNTALIMMLDRIPFLVLGPSNQVPEGAMDRANSSALIELEHITDVISK